MGTDITDYYENGLFIKRLTVITQEKVIKKIGEIVTEPKFDEVIYSDSQKEFMRLAVNRLKRGDNLNLLFSGLAGTGKTFSSKMIACETKRPFVYLTGSLGKGKIIEMMTNLKDDALILVDEIHNLSERTAEVIYPAIEYNELYLDGECVKLNNCVFIGTTTEPEKLPPPLLARFMRVEFEEPTKEMVFKILIKRGLTNNLIENMVRYTTNLRILNKIIKTSELYGILSLATLNKTFNIMNIDMKTGLSNDQKAYLNYLKKMGKAGLRNLSLILRRSENYIKYEIEPDLIRKQLINITSRGRELVV